MPVFSNHSKQRIKARGISEETVLSVIEKPDGVIEEAKCKRIYHKQLFEKETSFLVRVFVNVCRQPNVIITAYKTSKVKKYGN